MTGRIESIHRFSNARFSLLNDSAAQVSSPQARQSTDSPFALGSHSDTHLFARVSAHVKDSDGQLSMYVERALRGLVGDSISPDLKNSVLRAIEQDPNLSKLATMLRTDQSP